MQLELLKNITQTVISLVLGLLFAIGSLYVNYIGNKLLAISIGISCFLLIVISLIYYLNLLTTLDTMKKIRYLNRDNVSLNTYITDLTCILIEHRATFINKIRIQNYIVNLVCTRYNVASKAEVNQILNARTGIEVFYESNKRLVEIYKYSVLLTNTANVDNYRTVQFIGSIESENELIINLEIAGKSTFLSIFL